MATCEKYAKRRVFFFHLKLSIPLYLFPLIPLSTKTFLISIMTPSVPTLRQQKPRSMSLLEVSGKFRGSELGWLEHGFGELESFRCGN